MTGRIEKLQRAVDITVRWVAFPLHPETPPEGRTLEDLFSGRPVNVPEMLSHLKQTAQSLGLPFGDRKMTFNSRSAQVLEKWAETEGCGEAFHHAVFRIYFHDGLNIALPDVLCDIAESVGLSRHAALSIINSRRYRDAVDRDWLRSRELGITAVPTFLMNDDTLVGAHPYSNLLEWVTSHLAKDA